MSSRALGRKPNNLTNPDFNGDDTTKYVNHWHNFGTLFSRYFERSLFAKEVFLAISRFSSNGETSNGLFFGSSEVENLTNGFGAAAAATAAVSRHESFRRKLERCTFGGSRKN